MSFSTVCVYLNGSLVSAQDPEHLDKEDEEEAVADQVAKVVGVDHVEVPGRVVGPAQVVGGGVGCVPAAPGQQEDYQG